MQGGIVVGVGSVLAAGAAPTVAAMINAAYVVAYLEDKQLCVIASLHILGTAVRLVAVRPVLRIAPSEGMREA